MLPLLAAAILAGLLGILAHQAGEGPEYVARLRLMLPGAAALGYLAVAVFAWRRTRGWRRGGALVAGLAAVRILYVPNLALALLATGWMEWIAAKIAGRGPSGAVLHYALACMTSALASLGALLFLAALAHAGRLRAWPVLLAYVGLGVLVFAGRGDRTAWPHPRAAEAAPPATRGPAYFEVAADADRGMRTRILAAAAGLRHLAGARSGWHGTIRDELLARFRGNPDQTLNEGVTALEAALLRTH